MSLEFENVSYSYNGVSRRGNYQPPAKKFSLNALSFKIKSGICTALTGENGSGKTTLGKLCAGILKPDKGRVLVAGEDIAPLTLGQIGERAGYLFQNPERQIFAPTVLEDLTFPALIAGEDEAEACERGREMLDMMQLFGLENRSVFRLSGGEKQRLALAGLLMRNPRLLILDEPTTGIDAANRERLGKILRERQKDGVTVLLITHDINFADKYCDSRLTIDEGALC